MTDLFHQMLSPWTTKRLARIEISFIVQLDPAKTWPILVFLIVLVLSYFGLTLRFQFGIECGIPMVPIFLILESVLIGPLIATLSWVRRTSLEKLVWLILICKSIDYFMTAHVRSKCVKGIFIMMKCGTFLAQICILTKGLPFP